MTHYEPTSSILERLRSGRGAHEGLGVPTIETGTNTEFGPVRLAVDADLNVRLLLPVGIRERQIDLADTRALAIGVASFIVEGRSVRFIEITCLEKRLEPLFIELADEMRRRIEAGGTSIQACETTIEDYRSLLIAATRQRPSTEELAGIIGELLVLERLLDTSPLAWQAWKGPLGDRHDFRTAVNAIEVKTSLGKGNQRIKISSLDQLAPPTGGELTLAHVQLESAASGGLTLSVVAERCFTKASSSQEIRRLLSELGFALLDDDEQSNQAFNLEGMRLFAVQDDFPRLTSAQLIDGRLPKGIASLNYIVDLGLATACLLTAAQERDCVERMAT